MGQMKRASEAILVTFESGGLLSYLSFILYKGENWSLEKWCDYPRILQRTGGPSTSPDPNLPSLNTTHSCTCVCTLTHHIHIPLLSMLQHAKLFPAQCLLTYCSFWLECFSPHSWANQCIFWALVQIQRAQRSLFWPSNVNPPPLLPRTFSLKTPNPTSLCNYTFIWVLV